MACCRICGDEERLSRPVRFWSPDDGWMVGHLCPCCLTDARKRQPKRDDYAWDRHGEYVADVDEAIDELYG